MSDLGICPVIGCGQLLHPMKDEEGESDLGVDLVLPGFLSQGRLFHCGDEEGPGHVFAWFKTPIIVDES